MLISNLELEKKALNLRLWEANISKIELAAGVTRQSSDQSYPETTVSLFGKESVMTRVGILESSVALDKYFTLGQASKDTSVCMINLAKDVEFVVESEMLKRLNAVKCSALIQEAKLSNANDLLVQSK